ncbi:MAG: bud emergence protein 1 [Chaenotheca gracillima]|nr:MAG: bud emergence protein 1 [Chaenotheca gracillima]
MERGPTSDHAVLPDVRGQVRLKDAALTKPQSREKNASKKLERNTHNLGFRLAVDAAAAGCAGSLVAPVIAVIDRGIIENASGRNSLLSSVTSSFKQMMLRPHHFLVSRPFRLIFALYGGTYLTANTIDTASSTISNKKASTTTSGSAKFLATSFVNTSVCFYKDAQFVRAFGPVNCVPRPIPLPSYVLFGLRDSLTILASFNLPPLLAPHLPISQAFEKSAFTKISAAQFIAPAGIQLISTPLHLLGLDLYNRGLRDVTPAERWRKVRQDWFKSSIARMCRIVPAFGVGGIVNMKVRSRLMHNLERP